MTEIPLQTPVEPYGKVEPPVYSKDILAPPQFQGPPGQLIPWSSTSTPVHSKYAIYGTDSQVVQVLLQPGEQVFSEPGAMMYRADGIHMKTSMGGCSQGCKRCCGGESMFKNEYTNRTQAPASITLTPNFPSKIIPVDLNRSGTITASPGLYIGHLGQVTVTFRFIRSVMAGCFGGGGFLMQEISGTGIVFLAGGGTIMEKLLGSGERLVVDTHSVVAFSKSVGYGVESTKGCLNCCCGGEGLFSTALTGPGLVVTQSMSRDRLRMAIGLPAGSNASSNPADG